jgi:hypothetical protein
MCADRLMTIHVMYVQTTETQSRAVDGRNAAADTMHASIHSI